MGESLVAAVPREMLADVWPVAAPLLQKAIEHSHGEMTIDDVKEQIDTGESLLVVIANEEEGITTAILADIVTFPRRQVMMITLCGGKNADEWLSSFLDDIARVAKEKGADAIRLVGRRGWVRKLKKYGWDELYAVAEMRV